jgi:putative nucleotidyltransferase with HDIG domain
MNHSRDEAWSLLCEHTKSESLRKHALAVEAAMRWYARKFGEDEELYGLTGLLHDFDYEEFPDREHHPARGMAILREQGWPEAMIEAIGGHATYLNIPRVSTMAKCLFAVDELCGFLTACAYVKPDRKIASVEPASVRKKLKDKAFARSVSREDILQGTEQLGVLLDEHIANCVAAMTEASDALGL